MVHRDKRRVLIVDDEPQIRMLLLAFLRHKDFEVLEAHNGREALAIMRAAEPDVVVMDLMMPEVSGWDVLLERAADPSLSRIPMIVMTANKVGAVIDSELAGQVFAVISKPFDLTVILSAINTCLAHPRLPDLVAA